MCKVYLYIGEMKKVLKGRRTFTSKNFKNCFSDIPLPATPDPSKKHFSVLLILYIALGQTSEASLNKLEVDVV